MSLNESILKGLRRGVERHWRYAKDFLCVKPEYLLTISVADELVDNGFGGTCGLDLSVKLEEPTHLIVGHLFMHGLGFREYRQVAVAFMERHMKYKVDEFRWNMNSILDLQAGHKSRTAGRDYATATGDLREVTREAMHQYYLASCEWHDLMLKHSKGAITIIPNMEEIVERLRAVEMAAQVHNCTPTNYDGPSMEDLVELFSGLGACKKPTGNSGMTSLISI